jgi:hypothetical protein
VKVVSQCWFAGQLPAQLGASELPHGGGATHVQPTGPFAQICPVGHVPSHSGAEEFPQITGPATHTHTPAASFAHC